MVNGLHDPNGPRGLGKNLDNLSFKILGAALEVHKALGPGFLESVYENALCVELKNRGLSFERQFPLTIKYREEIVGTHRLDLLIENCVVVELKTVDNILEVHKAQILHYLKAAKLKLGLLINFKTALLKNGIFRIVN